MLLACGFASGLVITGRMRNAADATAQPQTAAPPAATAPAPVVPGRVPLSALPDFTQVAERTVPAVTNISSTQVVRRPNSPYSNDPFFRYFFGDQDDVFGSRRGVQSSLGSGVIISADGYILTNNHVVAGDGGRLSARQLPAITVTLDDKREMKADIIGVDPATDLALLKINANNLRVMPWG